LQAALARGSKAVTAWDAWQSSVDIDKLDRNSQRLLPLLHQNLRGQGVDSPLLSRFQGVHRATWFKNQMMLHRAAPILARLHEAGIRTMVLKGAALNLLYYTDYGLRSMDDVDILVPTEEAPAAIDVLAASGLGPGQKPLKAFDERYFALRHGHGFADAAGRSIDLHWHAMLECCYPGADDDFWDGAVSTQLDGEPTRALNATDQLLHVCVHRAEWAAVPPLRWAADAMMILDASLPDIDWDRLLAQVERRRLVLHVESALSFLQDLLDAPVPSSVLKELRGMRVSRAERIEYQARTSLPGLGSVVAKLYFTHTRAQRARRPLALPWLLSFPRSLQVGWALDHVWQVPLYAAAHAGRGEGAH